MAEVLQFPKPVVPPSTSASVAELQQQLNLWGFNVGKAPDGVFHDGTRAAINALQRKLGLPPTGNFDRATVDAVARDLIGTSSIIRATQRTMNLGDFGAAPAVLKKGDKGPGVALLQKALVAAGYDVGEIDGIFGPKTEAAVVAANGDLTARPDADWDPRQADAVLYAALEEKAKAKAASPIWGKLKELLKSPWVWAGAVAIVGGGLALTSRRASFAGEEWDEADGGEGSEPDELDELSGSEPSKGKKDRAATQRERFADCAASCKGKGSGYRPCVTKCLRQ